MKGRGFLPISLRQCSDPFTQKTLIQASVSCIVCLFIMESYYFLKSKGASGVELCLVRQNKNVFI